jgi:hypothetical protein
MSCDRTGWRNPIMETTKSMETYKKFDRMRSRRQEELMYKMKIKMRAEESEISCRFRN